MDKNLENPSQKVNIVAPDGASAEIYVHGAHISSWCPMDGRERLFLSKKAIFRKGIPIRGGIPICFPQFNEEGPITKHGFVRIKQWKFVQSRKTNGSSQAIFQMEDDDETRAIWPHEFRTTLTVTIEGSKLLVEFVVTNKGLTPFAFTGALHTYLLINDISEVRVEKLRGSKYIDSITGKQYILQTEDDIKTHGEIDRLYSNAPCEVVVQESNQGMRIRSSGFTDIVVWNPGEEKSRAMADMEPMGYRKMLCIESAIVSKPQEVPVGKTWSGKQELIAI